MNHYIDILIKPDAEMRENVLLNKVITKLHKALVSLNTNAIGVSFPQYQLKLGRLLRIHGNSIILNELQTNDWLGGIKGYCHLSETLPIPKLVKYRVISRKQSNMTQAKLNRLIKRGSISPDEVKAYKAKMFSQSLDNPYLELESGSNGHKHRRFIEFGELLDSPISGNFDTFGLSKDQATVPWF